MKRTILAFLFLIGLTACSITPMPDGTSGIEGQVLIGPTCPVVGPNDPDCADKPYQATLTVLNPSGQKVIQFTTDVEGKFRVSLNPGDYILHPESPSDTLLPVGQEQPFTVIAGQFTKLTVSYDSGIR
jgi:hypothetical protein